MGEAFNRGVVLEFSTIVLNYWNFSEEQSDWEIIFYKLQY